MMSALLPNQDASDWPTPAKFFAGIVEEFGPFDLDAAASPLNAKARRFYTEADDGLKQPWTGTVWCNPPYGRGIIDKWVQKAADEAELGATVVMLVRGTTSAAWWHDHGMRAAEILFVRHRLKFNDQVINAPFESVVLVFRPGAGPPIVGALDRAGRRIPFAAREPEPKTEPCGTCQGHKAVLWEGELVECWECDGEGVEPSQTGGGVE